jgi:hypothetical protein
VLFTGIIWIPPHGISDERKGYPLIVPRMGTRARVPKNSGTSTGGVITATTPASRPSILAVNLSFSFVIEPFAIESSLIPVLLNFNRIANPQQDESDTNDGDSFAHPIQHCDPD